MDTIHKRTAYIAVSETDHTTHNRKVTIMLQGTTPNVILFHSDTEKDNVDYTRKVTTTVADPDNNFNVLYDPEDTDRYKFIATVASPITANLASFYYDNKFKDIFVIPNLLSVGTDSKVELYKDRTIEIDGYKALGQGNNSYYTKDLSLPVITNEDDPNNIKLSDIPNRVDTTESYLVNISGLYPNSNIHMVYRTYPNNDQLGDSNRVPIIFVDLGTVNSLFGKDVKLPTFNILDKGLSNSVLDYLGIINTDRFIVPLSF